MTYRGNTAPTSSSYTTTTTTDPPPTNTHSHTASSSSTSRSPRPPPLWSPASGPWGKLTWPSPSSSASVRFCLACAFFSKCFAH
jgi:hypothetical protein